MGDAITRVVLVPRPPDNQRGKGTGPKRSIRIEWTRDWSLELFGYLGATSTLTPEDASIGSPKGKSWREWRKAKLLPR